MGLSVCYNCCPGFIIATFWCCTFSLCICCVNTSAGKRLKKTKEQWQQKEEWQKWEIVDEWEVQEHKYKEVKHLYNHQATEEACEEITFSVGFYSFIRVKKEAITCFNQVACMYRCGSLNSFVWNMAKCDFVSSRKLCQMMYLPTVLWGVICV